MGCVYQGPGVWLFLVAFIATVSLNFPQKVRERPVTAGRFALWLFSGGLVHPERVAVEERVAAPALDAALGVQDAEGVSRCGGVPQPRRPSDLGRRRAGVLAHEGKDG